MSRLLAVLAALMLPGAAVADDDIAFFESKVRPVLAAHCYECHAQKANKRKGGLTLDTRDGLRQGGDRGPAIVPGKPDDSLLLRAIRHDDPDLKMPPKGKLPAAAIADLTEWIKRGAADPRTGAAAAVASEWDDVLRQRRRWWSLQPVQKPPLPAVREATQHPIDRFILARLEPAGLHPARQADQRTLIRRLSLVLTGLPPSPAEVERFLQRAAVDPAAALDEATQRLLDSPHFGERWARHWLDVVRFTETHGNEWNYEVHHAWRYRDYLIRAFNADVPYDQLVREHIAGDLLHPPRWNRAEACNESVIGTAFYRFGEVNHDDCIEFRQIGYDLADNQIDTLTKAFQATTVACARCHDHKLDAVSMRDYYALLGILRSSRLVSHTIDAPEVNAAPKARLLRLKDELRRELAALWRQDAAGIASYLLAAQAAERRHPTAGQLAIGLDLRRLESWQTVIKNHKGALEDPLYPWSALTAGAKGSVAEKWRALGAKVAAERKTRRDFNAGHFEPFPLADWQRSGQGVADALSGDFALVSGDAVLAGIYPAGTYTHLISQRLNGALRSPPLPARKYISFQALGGNTSAVRLVSNNCQLNYANYRALTRAELEWKRFAIPPDHVSLRTYAELMTKFDNPKFPDQLGTLGGDTGNARVPWHEAAADPRSFFGIASAVTHDCDETPRPELGHTLAVLAAPVTSEGEAAARYAEMTLAAVDAWAAGRASDEEARWLDWLLRRGLLSNRTIQTPRLDALVREYRRTEEELALPRIVPGLADAGSGYDQPLLARGDVKKPLAPVSRRYLEVLDQPPDAPVHGSGRLELAQRIASTENPLTARVMVNRLWHHVFGTGLVRTVDDFGHVGELPSHPELLDYLAARFVEDGWSIKKMLRLLVSSATFRQSSAAIDAARLVDPDNRLLHHYPARRLEAEAIRDSILAVSGRLDPALYGPSIHPFRDKPNADRRLFPGPLDGAGRRSIYLKVNLMEAHPFLAAFNSPGGKVTQGRRDTSNVPAQALALLNDPFVLQQAEFWAQRLTTRTDATAGDRIDHLFDVALNRPPTAAERQRFERALAELAQVHGVSPGQVLASREVWADMAQAMFNLKEFIYVH